MWRNSKIPERGTVEKPNCWMSARLTALIRKGVDGKCPGRIVGLQWVRPGEGARDHGDRTGAEGRISLSLWGYRADKYLWKESTHSFVSFFYTEGRELKLVCKMC